MLRSVLLLLAALLIGCQGPSAGSAALHQCDEAGPPRSEQSAAAAPAEVVRPLPAATHQPPATRSPRVYLELDGPESARAALEEVLQERGFALVDAPPGGWGAEAMGDEPEKLQTLLSQGGCDFLVVVRFDAERLYGRAIGAHTSLQLVAQILPAVEPGNAARSFGCFIADTIATQGLKLAAR